MDAHAITLATRGLYVGVAPLGTALTEEQAAQLARLHSPVIVATDADLSGRTAAEKAHWLLSQHNIPTFTAAIPEGTDPADLLHERGGDAVTDALLSSAPLADVLLHERLTNLPANEVLQPAVQVLATADPAGWDRTCREIADRTGTNVATTRRALYRSVRTWRDNPRTVVTRQLDNAREVRARPQAVANQAPEQRWSPAAARLDHRLTAQQDWPALARTMQRLHEQGHDAETLARASIDAEPLVLTRPAQDLRYRLAAVRPPVEPNQPGPQTRTASAARRDENHRILAPAQDRSGGIPR